MESERALEESRRKICLYKFRIEYLFPMALNSCGGARV